MSQSIFGVLDKNDREKSLDAKMLTEVLKRCSRFIDHFEIHKCRPKFGCSVKNFKQICIDHTKIDIVDIVCRKCPKLRSIVICGPFLNSLFLNSLEKNKSSITELSLISNSICPFNVEIFNTLISWLQNLKYLKISFFNLSVKFFNHLTNQIEEIHMINMAEDFEQDIEKVSHDFYLRACDTLP